MQTTRNTEYFCATLKLNEGVVLLDRRGFIIDTSGVNGPLTHPLPSATPDSLHISLARLYNGRLIATGALRFIDLSMAARENGEFTTPQVLSSAVRIITAWSPQALR